MAEAIITETVTMPDNHFDEFNICIRCGLCCDGTLFKEARISKRDDLAFLLTMGVSIHEDNGNDCFGLPCKGLDGTLCTLYHNESRFSVCRNFQCHLLKRYLASEVLYDSALKIIREVIARRQSIAALYAELQNVPDSTIFSLIETLKKSGKLDDVAFRKRYSQQILDCLILEKLINECFFGSTGASDMKLPNKLSTPE